MQGISVVILKSFLKNILELLETMLRMADGLDLGGMGIIHGVIGF